MTRVLKMLRLALASASLALFGAASLSAGACAQSDQSARGGARDDLVIIETDEGSHRFTVELADSDEERRVGLMFREQLAADAGMLFDFGDPQPVSMWMKNTLIPLDMAFIDEDGVIRRIAAETTPRSLASISSGAPVVAVLEVNGGAFAALGVEEGDVVRHPMFDAD